MNRRAKNLTPQANAKRRPAAPPAKPKLSPAKPKLPPAKPILRPAKPILRGRVWIESDGIALTEAGADLLEQIEATGSLSEGARRLRFSYRRAWMLVDAMNRRWDGPLVTTAVGGKRGGGTKVTPLGRAVLSAYRDLQVQLEALLDHAAGGFDRATRGR